MESDDADGLAELLRFVDEFSDAGATSSRVPPRRSRRAEIAELRGEIARLERGLATANKSMARCGVGLTQLEQLWRVVTDRQMRLRIQAQRENKELQQDVVKARKLMRTVDKMLRRALSSLPAAVSIRDPSPPTIPPTIHARYLAQVLSEAVCGSSGRCAMYRGDKRELRFARTDDLSALVKEVEVVWTLPFAVDDVTDAVWHETTRMSTLETDYAYTDLLETPDTLVSQVIGTPKLLHDAPALSGQIATRQVCLEGEHEAQLIVCNVYMLSDEAQMHGHGWIRVEQVAHDGPDVSRIFWCQQIYMHPTPAKHKWSSHTREEAALTRLHNSFVAGARREQLEMNLQHRLQGIENWLLTPAHLRRSVASAS